jgi:hypothetical protein
MSYTRHDKDNTPVDPQPLSNTIVLYDGSEGWPATTYKIWNGNYVARKSDNTSRTPGTYQKRDINNNVVVPSTYQRHDIDNNPILN